MDTIDHKWNQSIFSEIKNERLAYFFAKDGWKNKYVDRDVKKGRKKVLGVNLHPAFTDAWHFFKSLMVVSTCIVILEFPKLEVITEVFILDFLIYLIFIGGIWNTTFSLFYNRILRKK